MEEKRWRDGGGTESGEGGWDERRKERIESGVKCVCLSVSFVSSVRVMFERTKGTTGNEREARFLSLSLSHTYQRWADRSTTANTLSCLDKWQH